MGGKAAHLQNLRDLRRSASGPCVRLGFTPTKSALRHTKPSQAKGQKQRARTTLWDTLRGYVDIVEIPKTRIMAKTKLYNCGVSRRHSAKIKACISKRR